MGKSWVLHDGYTMLYHIWGSLLNRFSGSTICHISYISRMNIQQVPGWTDASSLGHWPCLYTWLVNVGSAKSRVCQNPLVESQRFLMSWITSNNRDTVAHLLPFGAIPRSSRLYLRMQVLAFGRHSVPRKVGRAAIHRALDSPLGTHGNSHRN